MRRSDLPTGTVTFLFTDVERSTRLLRELGAVAYAEALAEHRRVIRAACAAQGGVEVDTQGDAFFFAFPTAPGALSAASALTGALAAGAVRVRVGLHTGTPLLTDEGYVGEDVHFAARVAASAHGGQVVVSSAMAALVDGSLLDLGEHRLKDIAEPVAIFQLGEGAFPPLKTISNTNLPRPASSFVGREVELREVLARVEGGARLLTLTGPGGSGKTRLALEAAATLVPEYKAGVFWVGLAALRDPALVTETIAQTLGAKDGLAEHVGERELLLLLDNLEQVVESAPELAALLERCPNLTLLVTSRELMRVQGEVEFPVPPLAMPEALALFCARAQLEPSEKIAELCARLDNLPLAVELAAARTKALSPGQILERLSQRLDLLKGGRDADPRQQTLRATIEWSYDLLTHEEQTLFARLSVFSGGCTLEATEEVCEAGLDTLQSLVEKSLLRFTDERYWMLETVREYAEERLVESGERSDIGRRHAACVLAWASRARERLYGGEEERLLEQFEHEQDNVRRALAWLDANGDVDQLLRLVADVWAFWEIRGEWSEGRRWTTASLERAGTERARRAVVLTAAGTFARHMRDWDDALALQEEALSIAREGGDLRAVVSALTGLSMTAVELGRYDEAAGWYEDASAIAAQLESPRLMAMCRGNLADLALRHEDYPRAADYADQALALYRELGWTPGLAWTLYLRAVCLLKAGRMDEAAGAAREGLMLAHAVGDAETIMWLLVFSGVAASERTEHELAAALLGVADEFGDRVDLVLTGVEQELRHELVATTRSELGDLRFDALYAEGRATSTQEGVERALASLADRRREGRSGWVPRDVARRFP